MTDLHVRIERYSPENKRRWDEFAARSRERCFIFQRDYIDYHGERFSDHSLLAFKGQRIIALLPLEVDGERAFSHRGLTFGGWLTPTGRFDVFDMDRVFEKLIEYLRTNGVKEFIYKRVPTIYSVCGADEDAFVLEKLGGERIKSDITMAIDLTSPQTMRYDTRQNIKRATASDVVIEREDCYEEFWRILSERLEEKYNAHPVHTLQEIKLLKAAFPKNIHLYTARERGELAGGVVVYESTETIKAQYIATTRRGRDNGAVAAMIERIIGDYRLTHKYFDLGTSNGNGILGLNEGLIRHKYGLGGRPVMTEVYRLVIS